MAGKRSLPEKFKERLTQMLGEDEVERYEACLSEPLQHGLRVNTGRLSGDTFAKMSPWELEPIPWCASGYYLPEDVGDCPPSRHPFYYAGAYYLQEPSAMLPAAALPVEPGDRVLDLCAAPGGKSTALAEKLQGQGVLLCNDVSASRAKALIKNLELFGVSNAVVTAEMPERLASVFSGYFDKILIDAPCSGEGMFRKSSAMIADWTEDKPKEYAALQREILQYAIRMLRPGGMLLYSTCTYAPEEDEGSVSYLLNLPEAKELELELVELSADHGFLQGNPDWIPEGSDELKKTVHLFPHRVRGEGHFAALFRSRKEGAGTASGSGQARGTRSIRSFGKISPEYTTFTEGMVTPPDAARLSEQNGYVSLVPDMEDFPKLAGLRVLRRGLFLGEVKKGRFEPSQALAMTLTPDTFRNCLKLSLSDDRVLRYLRGETLEYAEGEAEDGWTLVTVEGLPLGFGKAKNGSLKNKYLPGWRMT